MRILTRCFGLGIALLLAIAGMPVMGFSAEREAQAPSDYRSLAVTPKSIGVLSNWYDDLRRIFCSPQVLQDRIQRSVCVVDDYATFKEIPVKPGEVVRDVLARAQQKLPVYWQLRLIQKNAIEQTPEGRGISETEATAFLAKPVYPGDFLIITVLRENDRGGTDSP